MCYNVQASIKNSNFKNEPILYSISILDIMVKNNKTGNFRFFYRNFPSIRGISHKASL